MTISRPFEGSVLILECQTCSRNFSTFVFSADTDMPIIGLRSLTDPGLNRIVVAEEPLANLTTGRVANLRAVKLVRAEDQNHGLAGLTFGEFRKQYRPSRLVYQCLYCERGEALVCESISVSEFRRRGGILEAVGGLYLNE